MTLNLPWKLETENQFGGTPVHVIRDSTGAVIMQEPTTFYCYDSGSYLTADGQKEILEWVVKLCNAAAPLEE